MRRTAPTAQATRAEREPPVRAACPSSANDTPRSGSVAPSGHCLRSREAAAEERLGPARRWPAVAHRRTPVGSSDPGNAAAMPTRGRAREPARRRSSSSSPSSTAVCRQPDGMTRRTASGGRQRTPTVTVGVDDARVGPIPRQVLRRARRPRWWPGRGAPIRRRSPRRRSPRR